MPVKTLSELAIRHISEVTKNYPEHFKALFVEAREHYKLGEYNLANPIVEKGLNICIDLGEKEFQHRFKISVPARAARRRGHLGAQRHRPRRRRRAR